MSANFDGLASSYRWLEYASFGPSLERCRFAQLRRLSNSRRAILLGDGDGRFLAALLASNSLLTADVIDSSRSMLRLLDRRIRRMCPAAHQRIQLHHADALSWEASGSYDLVVSHFFLDCFFPWQIEELLDRLLPHLERGAYWLVSEFSVPNRAAMGYLSKHIIRLLYKCFGVLAGLPVRALPDYSLSMRKRRLVLVQEEVFLGGLLRSQLWSFQTETYEHPPCNEPFESDQTDSRRNGI